MGLFAFLRRLLFGSSASPQSATVPTRNEPALVDRASGLIAANGTTLAVESPVEASPTVAQRKLRNWRTRNPNGGRPEAVPVKLSKLRYRSTLIRTPQAKEQVATKPYRFSAATLDFRNGERWYLDLTQDADERWLSYYGLPLLRTPQELADWLQVPLGRLAWLTQRHHFQRRAPATKDSHYHYQWVLKRSGGYRLIEAPKQTLKAVQTTILRELLDRVPPHPAAHGFVEGRSIITNSRPHVGQRFLLKFDLQNFYPSVSYRRVVAIFRSLGFSREVAIWLGRLTTTSVPRQFESPDTRPGWHYTMDPYIQHHLPQGAPTSPAIANLSAYSLDVRLSGLAAAYHMNFTRYADDLTFSGTARVLPALTEFIPLTQQIIRSEQFQVNRAKRKILRSNQRQVVTGVVVNERQNVSRFEYDRLKATLHNCIQHGPASQNHDGKVDFVAHLRGRIAHVLQLNPARGQKLLALFQRIDWRR